MWIIIYMWITVSRKICIVVGALALQEIPAIWIPSGLTQTILYVRRDIGRGRPRRGRRETAPTPSVGRGGEGRGGDSHPYACLGLSATNSRRRDAESSHRCGQFGPSVLTTCRLRRPLLTSVGRLERSSVDRGL